VAHDVRDAIMDFIAHWSERTESRAQQHTQDERRDIVGRFE